MFFLKASFLIFKFYDHEQVEAHKNQRSQSMGALTGRRSPTSAAPSKMSNSGSFIDFNEEPAPTSNAPVADLVVESSQETTAPSNSTDWATFNSATLAVAPPPPGYPEMPAPKNDQVQWSATAWPSNSGFVPWSLGVTSHSPSSLQVTTSQFCCTGSCIYQMTCFAVSLLLCSRNIQILSWEDFCTRCSMVIISLVLILAAI